MADDKTITERMTDLMTHAADAKKTATKLAVKKVKKTAKKMMPKKAAKKSKPSVKKTTAKKAAKKKKKSKGSS